MEKKRRMLTTVTHTGRDLIIFTKGTKMRNEKPDSICSLRIMLVCTPVCAASEIDRNKREGTLQPKVKILCV